jgi:Ran GTPase-activating protein (RanGAP) involved in mRNA processing and transport
LSCDKERDEPLLQGVLRGLGGGLTTLRLIDLTFKKQPWPWDIELKLLEVLAEELPACTNMTNLELSGNSLDVPGNAEGAPGYETFMEMLGMLTGLKELVLRNTMSFVLPDLSESLGKALSGLTRLTRLHLQDNNLSGHGAKEVGSALVKLTGLYDLNIAGTHIGWLG